MIAVATRKLKVRGATRLGQGFPAGLIDSVAVSVASDFS